jgi:cell division protein FtsB
MLALLRQLGYLAAVGVACFYVFVALKGPNGVPAMMEKKEQIERLKQQNDTLRQEIERRRKYIDHLENSDETRERAIREHTHKSKGNETTIYLQDDDAGRTQD